MPIGLVGLLSATVFCIGLAALFWRPSISGKALGFGLMLQAALFFLVGVSRHFGQIDGQVLGFIGISLMPLVCLPWRSSSGAGDRPPAREKGDQGGEAI